MVSDMGMYVLCPFYVDDSRKSVTCEDVCRRFSSTRSKFKAMKTYCCSSWESCTYAQDMMHAYERYEKGDESALDAQREQAVTKEMKSLQTKLGRAEKRIEAMLSEIRSLRQKTHRAEELRRDEHLKRRKAESMLQDYEKHEAERYGVLARIYEDRMCYLIDTYCGGRLREEDVRKWAKGKEYALTHDEKSEERVWVVITRKERKDGKGAADSSEPCVQHGGSEEEQIREPKS